jgi:molybdate transport repressor ModE-like protein
MENKLRVKLSVRLYGGEEERCFGPGIATLLHRVEEHGSLRAAAASMGMAYSKAWRIVRTAQAVFGQELLHSAAGGRGGGGAVLTPAGRKLLTAYDRYCAKLEEFGAEIFRETEFIYRRKSECGIRNEDSESRICSYSEFRTSNFPLFRIPNSAFS